MNTELNSIVKELVELSNSQPSNEIAHALFEAMRTEHRTIQQNFMRELNTFLITYSDELYDARNKESVTFAKKIKEMNHHFPYI